MGGKAFLAAGLAAALLVFGAGAAMAAQAQATSTVNVRSGPGTGYAIVDKLHPGELVDMIRCNEGWCYVGKSGTDGWVAQAYLQRLSGPAIIAPPPVIIHPPIVVRPPIRPPHYRPPHHRPPHRPPHKPPVKPPVCKPGAMLPGCLHPLPGPKPR